MSTNSDGFRFSDQQWRDYQNMPEQGYSHRHHLEFVFNAWLAEHDRATKEAVWMEGFDAGERDVWEHDHTKGWQAGCTPNPYSANALVTDERTEK